MKLRDSLVVFLLMAIFFGFVSCNKEPSNYISRHERIEEDSSIQTYYTLPAYVNAGILQEDLFFNESSILENSIFLLGHDYGQIKVYKISASPLPLFESEKNTLDIELSSNQIFQNKLPEIFSSLPNHSRNISLTSSESDLFLLQNQYEITVQEPETENSFVFKNQIVNKINPSKNTLTTLSIESDESINQIRYGRIENSELFLASSKNNPFTLKYCVISDSKLTFTDFFNSKKEILAWDFKENQLIILFSNRTVEHFFINLSNKIPAIEKQTILDSLDEQIKRSVIQINPFKGSFLLWEAVANGKTWLLVDAKKVKSYWCNIDTSTHSSFINEVANFQNKDSSKVFVGANIVSQIDPSISLCSFFVLGNTQEDSSYQWLSVGTRTIDESLLKMQKDNT